MKMCDIEGINKIAKYLKVPAGKLTINKRQLITRSTKDEVLEGFIQIVTSLAEESKVIEPFSSNVDKCLIYRWIEFAKCYSNSLDDKSSKMTLKELNTALESSSYLVGYSLSIADIVVFYGIQSLMASLSHTDKENHLHLSRWFEHLQQDKALRQGAALVNFSTIHLV